MKRERVDVKADENKNPHKDKVLLSKDKTLLKDA